MSENTKRTGSETMNKKIVLPELSDHIEETTHEHYIDGEDMIIESAHIKDCTISLSEIRLLECYSVRFTNVVFINGSLKNAYFKNVLFEKCEWINGEFSHSAMKSVQFKQCRLNGLLLSESTLEHVSFNDSMMTLSSFGYSTFKTVQFHQCQLSDTDLLEMTLKHVWFHSCNLNHARISQTSLKDVDISTSDFETLSINLEDIKGAIVNQSQALSFLKFLELSITDEF